LGRVQIVATGEGSARRYGLVTGQRDVVIAHLDEVADAIDDEDEVTWSLLGFGSHFFADWPIVEGPAVSGRNAVWEVNQSPAVVRRARRGGRLEGRRLLDRRGADAVRDPDRQEVDRGHAPRRRRALQPV